MHPDAEGWSEWIHPLPGYLMQCCDCGLIHEMEYAIGQRVGDGPLNEGESRDRVIIFRARRWTEDGSQAPVTSDGEGISGGDMPTKHKDPSRGSPTDSQTSGGAG